MRKICFSVLAILLVTGCTVEVDDLTSSPLAYNPPINTQDFRVRVRSNVAVSSVTIDVEGAMPTGMAATGSDQYVARVPLPACTGAANYSVTVDGARFAPRTFPEAGRFSRAVQGVPQECDDFPDGFARTFVVNRTFDFPDNEPGDGICLGANPTPGSDGCSLRAAIMEANASAGDDLIQILNGGRYEISAEGTEAPDAMNDTIGDYDITESVTIEGVTPTRSTDILAFPGTDDVPLLANNPDRGGAFVRIDAGQIDRHFHVSPGATLRLRSLTLLNGRNTGWGGSIRNRGVLSLERMILVENAAGNRGGAIYNQGTVFAVDTVFSRNEILDSSPQGGAIFSEASGDLTIRRTLFAFNGARFGSAVRTQGQSSFENVVFYGNMITAGNGGVINNGGSAFLNHASFIGNSGGRSSPPILAGTAVDTRNTLFYGNPQGPCGRVMTAGGNATDRPCTPRSGTALLPDAFDVFGGSQSMPDLAIRGGFFPIPDLSTSAQATIEGAGGVPLMPLTDARGPGFRRALTPSGAPGTIEDADAGAVEY